MRQYCIHSDCNKQASYNYPNEKKLLYCNKHKLNNMINIKHKHCIHQNCDKLANYNYPNNKKPLYCKNHKLENMIDVTHKRCIHFNCDKRPTYNYLNNKKPLYCKNHKLENMINVENKRCCHINCDKQPAYNYSNKKGGIYCEEHKLENMIDVINKRCIHINCDKQPAYNYSNKKGGIYCKEHKLENMINVISKRCINLGCDKRPNFNYPNMKVGLYCEKHKLNGMINVKDINRLCIKCSLFRGMKRNMDPKNHYCISCYSFLYPNAKDSKKYLFKQKEIEAVIRDKYSDNNIITFDKPLPSSKIKYRPDILFQFANYNLIVEIDENQHENYDCMCEYKRLSEIQETLDNKLLIVIRFNPDEYLDEDNKKIYGMFNKDNSLKIKKKEFDLRMKKLIDTIEYYIENNKDFENKYVPIIEYLYYDHKKINEYKEQSYYEYLNS